MNNSQIIIQYILKYGTAVIFLLLFLEQLNFPGLASSILMPAIGVFVAKYEYSFIYVFILTLVAAILGSLTLYYLGYFIGNPMINWVKNRFPKSKETIDKILMYTNKYGSNGVLLCRFIPGVNIGIFSMWKCKGKFNRVFNIFINWYWDMEFSINVKWLFNNKFN